MIDLDKDYYNKIDIEILAEAVHKAWLKQQLDKGWQYGVLRNEEKRISPCIIDYEDLSHEEKEKDRVTARAVIEELIKMNLLNI